QPVSPTAQVSPVRGRRRNVRVLTATGRSAAVCPRASRITMQVLACRSASDAESAQARCQAQPAKGDAAGERSRSRSQAAGSRASASTMGMQVVVFPVTGRGSVTVGTVSACCRGRAVVAAYVLTPFTLHTLGDARYGTWTLITSISGYLALLVLGVPMASVRYFAEHVASGDTRELNRAIGSCTGLYLLLGGVALVIGAGLYAFFNLSYDIPTTIRRDADWAFALTVAYVA